MSDIEPLGQATLAFFQKILGPVGEAGDFLTDKIRFYRWKSALKTIEKARKISEKRNVDIEEIPVKFLVPFMEGCSLEDEESELTDYWAQILADACKDKRNAKTAYVEILKSSSAEEIRLLNELVDSEFIEFLKTAPVFGEARPSLIVSGLTTMRRIQLSDHIEKSVQHLIDVFEEDLGAEADQAEEFLMTLAEQSHAPVKVENIVISDRAKDVSYHDENGNHDRDSDLKSRWNEVLENRAMMGANIGLVERNVEVDALTAKGLLDRTFHNFDAYDGHGFFSLICPTPLGVEFVCACRGDPLPYPDKEQE